MKKRIRKDDIEVSEENNLKKLKISRKELLKPPTNEELNQLRETENLFNSNLFRLQIDEMFNEIKIKQHYMVLFQEWLQNFSSFLEGLESSEAQEISCGRWLKEKNLKMPLKKHSAKVKGVFIFVKPAAVKVIGSYRSGCCVGPNAKVDILIQMPQKCFQRSDSLNHTYFYKRALYLVYLVSKLKEAKLVEDMQFSQSHGISSRPVLDLKPHGKLGKHFSVTLHLVPPLSCFKLHLFSPRKNNVRKSWFFQEESSEGADSGPPTPQYNSNILMDLSMIQNDDVNFNALSENQNLKDGVKLLKIWLHQRELDEGYGSFGAFIMSMYVVYLMQERRVSNLMSSYQVVRTVWNCLAASDWTLEGISLAAALNSNQPVPLSEFHQHFDVVFVDSTGYYNLCANMSKWTFMRVKQECEYAVKCLDNPKLNSFQALFMTEIPFHWKFDNVITFHDESALNKMMLKWVNRAEFLDYGTSSLPLISRFLLTRISLAIEKRTKLIAEKLYRSQKWNIDEEPRDNMTTFSIGLILDPEHAYNTIEKGPEANTVEANQFRAFWGNKSELRRFPDGSVCEAILWMKSDAPLSQRRMVCKLAIGYILKVIGLEEEKSWKYFANQLDSLIKRVGSSYCSVEEECSSVIRATDSLSSNLRKLKGLPLEVTSVAGISPAHRYTDPFSPLISHPPSGLTLNDHIKRKRPINHFHLNHDENPHVPEWIPYIEVVIQLGISSKWPSSLDAIRRVRTAFNLKIAESLEEQLNIACQVHEDYITVFQDGYVFRVYLACPREISLLKEFRDTDGLIKYKDTEESIALEKRNVHLPKMSGVLHGLQQSYSAFGATCCYAKRWVASQLLLSEHHLSEICVELLVASLFLSPEPFTVPNQPQTAFIRFLNLLASRDWFTQPLILNFNEEISRPDILAIENKLGRSERTSMPPLVIVTPYDQAGDIWTKVSPSILVLVRLAHLASHALQIIESKISQRNLNFREIFRPALETYDVVLHLNPQMLPRINESMDPYLVKKSVKCNNHAVEKVFVKSLSSAVAFDPVQIYLQELRESYCECAAFFHDSYGGSVIGVLWKPTAHERKDIKASHFNGRMVDSNADKLILNFDAIIEDFSIIGKGILAYVTVKS